MLEVLNRDDRRRSWDRHIYPNGLRRYSECALFICCKTSGIGPRAIQKMVTVADGSKLLVKGKVVKVPVLLDALEAKMDFIVKQNTPSDLVTGHPTLKRLSGVLNFRK